MMMIPSLFLGLRRCKTVTVLILAMLSSSVTAQNPRADAAVEDIVILRSVLLSRITPTDFCAPPRTGFAEATAEDRYEFKAVATDAASGKVTNVTSVRAGTLHACFSPTPDALIQSFYAEGEVGGVVLSGRGQCRTTSDGPSLEETITSIVSATTPRSGRRSSLVSLTVADITGAVKPKEIRDLADRNCALLGPRLASRA